MSTSEPGRTSSSAEVYEEVFVPALMQEWAPRVVDAARIQPGQRVLDVACGTGVLTRAVATRVGPSGAAVGLDANDEMLAVARRQAPGIEWRQARAEALPFENDSFDALVSQFALMFFADRRAVEEMARVLRPGGRLAVAVWARLEDSPGYAAFTDIVQRRFGDQAADELRASFALGDHERVRALFTDTDLSDVDITTPQGTVRFPSVRSMVMAEVYGWTLGTIIDEAQVENLVEEMESVLQPFITPEGTLAFPIRAHIVTADKA